MILIIRSPGPVAPGLVILQVAERDTRLPQGLDIEVRVDPGHKDRYCLAAGVPWLPSEADRDEVSLGMDLTAAQVREASRRLWSALEVEADRVVVDLTDLNEVAP